MKRKYRLSTGELKVYSYPRHGKKRKVWLTETQVQTMLDLAKSHSKRDFLLMLLLRWSLRVGEVVGHGNLPGIHVEDVRDDGILVRGKGWLRGVQDPSPFTTAEVKVVPIPTEVIQLLGNFIAEANVNVKEKVFLISEMTAERIIKGYARKAGIPEGDWQLVTPHRLRAFFANNARWGKNLDSITIRDLMRHRSLRDTEIYLGTAPPDYLAAAVKKLAEGRPV